MSKVAKRLKKLDQKMWECQEKIFDIIKEETNSYYATHEITEKLTQHLYNFSNELDSAIGKMEEWNRTRYEQFSREDVCKEYLNKYIIHRDTGIRAQIKTTTRRGVIIERNGIEIQYEYANFLEYWKFEDNGKPCGKVKEQK